MQNNIISLLIENITFTSIAPDLISLWYNIKLSSWYLSNICHNEHWIWYLYWIYQYLYIGLLCRYIYKLYGRWCIIYDSIFCKKKKLQICITLNSFTSPTEKQRNVDVRSLNLLLYTQLCNCTKPWFILTFSTYY